MSVRVSKPAALPLYGIHLRRATVATGSLRLNEMKLIVSLIVAICVLSILHLAQTGRVATAGLRLQELEREHAVLMREAEQHQYRIATASRLDTIAERASALGLRRATSDQLRYATIEVPEVPVVAATSNR